MKNRISNLTSLAKGVVGTHTFKQSGITFVGIFLNGILGVIFYFLTARSLGPALYGVFSISILTLNLIADIGDFGVDTAVVRFVSKHFRDERQKALLFMKFGLKIKLFVWFAILVVGWFLVPVFAVYVLQKPELVVPLRASLVGTGGALLFSYSTHTVQALERFWLWSGLNVSMNFLRIIGLLIFLAIGGYTLWPSLYMYILFPFIGFIVSLLFLPKFLTVKNENRVAQEFFKYSKWVGAFTIIAAISARLDSYLTTRFLSLSDVGIYSVAVNLSGIVPQIVFALAVVVAPKLTKFKTKHEAKTYLTKVQMFVLALGIVGIIVGSALSFVVIPLLYGEAYVASIYPLIVLLIAQAIFLISIPAHTAVIYYFAYPKLFVWISAGHFLIILLGGYFLISQYGYMGAASTVLLGSVFNFLVPFVWALNKFKEE